jgi:hypothetical protein
MPLRRGFATRLSVVWHFFAVGLRRGQESTLKSFSSWVTSGGLSRPPIGDQEAHGVFRYCGVEMSLRQKKKPHGKKHRGVGNKM